MLRVLSGTKPLMFDLRKLQILDLFGRFLHISMQFHSLSWRFLALFTL